MKFVDL